MEAALQGRVCLMGVGNPAYGDDGLGVRLAEGLMEDGVVDAVVVGTDPDRHIGKAVNQRFDHVVFIDAVDFGGEPGSVVFLDGNDIAAKFPQISTHKISLGLMASLVESNGVTKAWLLGVQPDSLREGRDLSHRVSATLEVLREILLLLKMKDVYAC